ncbi:MAG: hypothetical protein ACFB2Z_00185 [Maricaulaceae bacterium]
MAVKIVACAIGGVFAALFALGPAGADDPTEDDLFEAADQIAGFPGVEDLFKMCPADYWASRRPWWRAVFGEGREWRLASCQQDLSQCVKDCVDGHKGSACTSVAQVLQEHDDETFDQDVRYGFALGCALGSATGCTNRGAGIRNYLTDIDPFMNVDWKTRHVCLVRTFAVACAAGSAWGCSMEGQAYRLGEGVKTDFTKARARFNRACRLSPGVERDEPGYGSCRFARRQLSYMVDNE